MLYVWRPAATERATYRTVYVHQPCRARLLAGHRPDGVRRHGLTPEEAFDLVVRCEGLALKGEPHGSTRMWSAYSPADGDLHRPLKRELRAARLPYAQKLEQVTEDSGGRAWVAGREPLLTFDRLALTISYLHRHHAAITDPTDLVAVLRDLQRRNKLHDIAGMLSQPATDQP